MSSTDKPEQPKDNTSQHTKSPEEEIEELLANNEDYVDYMNEKYPDFFKSLGATHKPKYLLIGCSDARIQPNALLKLNPGEL